MHWIYILRCDNNIIYVGETTRLYRRLIEHKNGKGSDTTHEFKPYKLMGIYKLKKDGLTFDCPINKDMYEQGFIDENKSWGLELENQITLMYMKAMNTKWDNVYGGKYHVGYRPENNPSNNISYLDHIVNVIYLLILIYIKIRNIGDVVIKIVGMNLMNF